MLFSVWRPRQFMELLNVYIYISVLLPLINCFIDSTCAFCVYCKCPIISNAWPLECEELKHLMTSLTFCFFTPQHFFSVQQGFLWVFYATRLLLEDFSLVFCVSLLQIFSELCRKQGWAKNRLCLRYWLIEEKEGYSHDFRLQEKHELPFYSPRFHFMSNTSLFLCFHSWPVRRNESAKFATLRLSGNTKSNTDTKCWSRKEDQHVYSLSTQLCRRGRLLTLGSRRKSAFCSRELMSPNGG